MAAARPVVPPLRPTRRDRSWRQRTALAACLVWLTACGGAPGPTPPEDAAVLAPNARVLDDATLAALVSVSEDGTYAFGPAAAALADVGVGDVLIMGVSARTPNGGLRAVDTIAPDGGGGTIVTTRQATLVEAFEELQLTATRTVTTGLTTSQSGLTFPLDLTASGGGGSVRLTGSLSVAPTVDLTIRIDLAAFTLEEFSLSFGANETFLATLTGSGSHSFRESVTLGSIPFTPIVLTVPTPLGAIPVIITPRAVIEAALEGTVQGSFDASVEQQASFEAGIGYRDGRWGGFSDSDSEFAFDAPSYGASLSVKASAGPRVEALIYGAVGPFARAAAYVELAATAEGPPACVRGVLDAGIAASAGMQFLADYETTLFNEAVELASFDTCTPGGGTRPAIGWARSYGRIGSVGENARAVVQVSDGTYLVVGNSTLTEGITGTGASVWALRLDALGNVLWQRAYGGGFAVGTATAAAQVGDDFLIATSLGIARIDSGGNPVWARGLSDGVVHSLVATAGGSAVLAGYLGSDAWAVEVDAGGDVVWSRTYGASSFHRIRPTSDGGYVAVGLHPGGAGDLLLARLGANGTPQWVARINNRYDSSGGTVPGATILDSVDTGLDAVELPGGGFRLVGESYGAFAIPDPGQGGYYAAWIADVDADGELMLVGEDEDPASIVHRVPVEANYTSGYAAALRSNGTGVVLGRYAPTVGDLLVGEDVLVIQGGAYARLGGPGNDSVQGGLLGGGVGSMPISTTADGGFVIAGTSDSFGPYEEAWVVKLGRTANLAFPYLVSVAGESLRNVPATGFVSAGTSSDAAIATSPTSMSVEVTPIQVRVQAP